MFLLFLEIIIFIQIIPTNAAKIVEHQTGTNIPVGLVDPSDFLIEKMVVGIN